MTRSFIPPAEGGSYVFDPVTGALDLVERGGTAPSAESAVLVEGALASEPAAATDAAPAAPAAPAAGDADASSPVKKIRKD
ncbi:hypothetical protein [Pinisolibacter sp.]|uniref:hypothetical protein n=1 Tax=Pinisolibacter sp. TaxID=2172024 RepID=UPI002FDDDE69